MTHLIFGCGYLGERVAARWRAMGHEVTAIVRRDEHAREIAKIGVRPIVGDVSIPDSLPTLPTVDTALFALPSDAIVCFLESHCRRIDAARILVVGTTGVYGDADGGWVDESTPPAPMRPAGAAALAVERMIAAGTLADKTTFLRMAGLYGPGRVPFLDKIGSGIAIPATELGWLNLIHVDDAADVLVAIAQQSPAFSTMTFNVTDGYPVIRRDYYAEAARILGSPSPRFVAPGPNDPRAARAMSNRRVSSAKLWGSIDITPRYRSYREGLAAIVGV